MWIVAGPNGAGKSTLTNMLLADIADPTIIKLNADEVTASLRASDPVTPQNLLNLQAAQMIDARWWNVSAWVKIFWWKRFYHRINIGTI